MMARKFRGLVSSTRHAKKTGKRWFQKFDRPFVSGNQCGDCKFFVPCNGAFPIEWGVCSNPSSVLDSLATIATYGCNHFEKIEELPLYLDMKHLDNTHNRWVIPYRESGISVDGEYQCGSCRYYVSLDGYFISDWGMCTNPLSAKDGKPMSEHDGCEHHVYCEQGWNGPMPRMHYVRKKKYKAQLW